jgi:Family of unknown function (DUF6496)
MPEKTAIERAREDAREGKSPSTQAGEFVREVIRDIRKGKHGARSAKQAIAIGLSKARRAGVELPPPKEGDAATRHKAKLDLQHSKKRKKPSAKRSRATTQALKRETTASASTKALAQQAKTAARKRSPKQRSAAAKKAARTRARG